MLKCQRTTMSCEGLGNWNNYWMYGPDCFKMGSKLRYAIPHMKLFFLICHNFMEGLWLRPMLHNNGPFVTDYTIGSQIY